MLYNIEDFTASLKRRQFLQNVTEFIFRVDLKAISWASGVELNYTKKRFFTTFTNVFFSFFSRFLRFLTFLKFLFEHCLHLWWLKRRDLRSFEIRFEFESAVPIRFDSDGPIRKFSNQPCLPIARSSQTTQTINDA